LCAQQIYFATTRAGRGKRAAIYLESGVVKAIQIAEAKDDPARIQCFAPYVSTVS
jgi:hypothetical protein